MAHATDPTPEPLCPVDVAVDASTPNPFDALGRDPHLGICRHDEAAPFITALGHLVDDGAQLDCQLHRFVRGQGVGAARREIESMRQSQGTFLRLGGDPERAATLEKVIGKLSERLETLETERDNFVADFAPRALEFANNALNNSAERMNAARNQYGLVRFRSDRYNGYVATDRDAVAELGRAARAIQRGLMEIDQLTASLYPTDRVTGQPRCAARGMSEAQAKARVAAKERELVEYVADVARTHPILANFTTGESLAKATAALAASDASAVRFLGTTVFDALDDIDTTRHLLADDPTRVFQLPLLIEGALSATGVDTRSMGASYIRDEVRETERERSFVDNATAALSMGLGVASMLTPAGWGLVALTVAAAVADTAQAFRTVESYGLNDAAAGIDPDPDRAMATKPSAIWAVIDVGAAITGSAGAVKGLTQGAVVRAMADDAFARIGAGVSAEIGPKAAAHLYDALGHAAFTRLGRELGGVRMAALVDGRHAMAVRFVASGLGGDDAVRLLRAFDDASLVSMSRGMSAKEVLLAEADLGASYLASLSGVVDGHGIGALHRAVGPHAGSRVVVDGGSVVIDGVARMSGSALSARASSLPELLSATAMIASKPAPVRDAVFAIADEVPRLLETLRPGEVIGLARGIDPTTVRSLSDLTGAELVALRGALGRRTIDGLAEAGLSGAEIRALVAGADAARVQKLVDVYGAKDVRSLVTAEGAEAVAADVDALLSARGSGRSAPGTAAGVTPAMAEAAGVSKQLLGRLDRLVAHSAILTSQERSLLNRALRSIEDGHAINAALRGSLYRISRNIDVAFEEFRPTSRGHGLATARMRSGQSIVDTQLVIGADKAKRGLPLTPKEVELAQRFESGPIEDLRVADATAAVEARGALPPGMRAISLVADRSSSEYVAVYHALTRYQIGGSAGRMDREIVADAFFAGTDEGVTATFRTADRGIVKRLREYALLDPNSMLAADPNVPFTVSINERTIRVVPE